MYSRRVRSLLQHCEMISGSNASTSGFCPILFPTSTGVFRSFTRKPSNSVAASAARSTAELRPRKGRARPLAEKSIGTPDPGAVSLAAVFAVLGPELDPQAAAAAAR